MKILRAIRRLWLLATCKHEEHFCVILPGLDRVAHFHRCKRCLQVFEYEEMSLLNGQQVPSVSHFRQEDAGKETLH